MARQGAQDPLAPRRLLDLGAAGCRLRDRLSTPAHRSGARPRPRDPAAVVVVAHLHAASIAASRLLPDAVIRMLERRCASPPSPTGGRPRSAPRRSCPGITTGGAGAVRRRDGRLPRVHGAVRAVRRRGHGTPWRTRTVRAPSSSALRACGAEGTTSIAQLASQASGKAINRQPTGASSSRPCPCRRRAAPRRLMKTMFHPPVLGARAGASWLGRRCRSASGAAVGGAGHILAKRRVIVTSRRAASASRR